ncbi:Fe-S oxidoreductase [Paenibacillus pasadenensis]|uniref:Fe-S oxidoreductase n=1 Tax=Paenibacillus pasadenensis TaxID=217090 RepID=A0A2N5N760_9BACL|nr:flagellar hook-length control protein FliK [Paenibacillus pasadenensis]PLT46196.1 Fe-S oxidoreductase [Paenibacillus pasadenensis]
MEMAITQSTVPTAGSSPVGTAAAKISASSSAGTAFQQLIGSMNAAGGSTFAVGQAGAAGSAAASPQGEAATLLQAAIAQLAGLAPGTPASAADAVSGAEKEDGAEAAEAEKAGASGESAEGTLLGQLDELLDLLTDLQDADAALSDEAMDAAASELGALLALLGLPAPQAQPATVGADQAASPDSLQGAAAGKPLVLESLLVLHQALQDGKPLKLGASDASALVSRQLAKLGELLAGTERSTAGGRAGGAADGQAAIAVKAAPAAFLERLNAASAQVRAALEAKPSAARAAEAAPAAAIDAAPGALPGSASSEAAPQLSAPAAPAPQPGAAQTAALPVVAMRRFAEEMAGIMLQKLDITASGQSSEARILLNPEHLGQVDIKLHLHNGQLTALFLADSPAAREAIENQLAQLRQSLQLQGIQVDRMEVGSGELQTSLSFGQQQGGGGRGQSFTGGGRATEEAAALREADAATQTAIRELGFGRSVNETA